MEAEMHQYVVNMWKDEFAVLLEMLQFEERRLARKRNVSASSKSVKVG
jgi:hypothetical protein